ncbi:MAG TPA: hypothetical protein VMZ27_17545 [Candidatus Saccharimonadales bacterium]|nr:hypothetical protein [Candidatus Saccharimonadales bacterium]
MKYRLFRTYNGKRIVYWPLLLLFVLLAGIAGAMAGVLLLVSADNLKMPLDFLYEHVVLFITLCGICFAVVAVLVSFWLHSRLPSADATEFGRAPNVLFKETMGRLMFVGVCVVTLIGLFYTFENWRGRRSFLDYKREMEAKGERLDMQGFIPPPVPDEQNLAAVSIFKGILDYERSPKGVVWRDTNNNARLDRLVRIASWGVHTKTRHSENLEKNELINFKGYQEYFLLNTNVPHAQAPQTPVQDTLLGLSEFEPDLEELKKAAATHPLSRFPVHYEETIGCLLPHLAKLKALQQYLKIHSTALLEAGRKEDAFADLQLMFQLADAVQDEPFMVSHMVRMATLTMSLQVLKEGLVRHAWTAEQLGWIQTRCARINLVREGELAVKGERAMGVECIDQVRRGALPIQAFYGEDENSPRDAFVRLAIHKLAPTGWYAQNKLSLCRFHDRYLQACITSSTPQVHAAAAEQIENDIQHLSRTPFNMIARLLSPAMTTYWVRTARWQTAVHHAEIACALEVYRLAEGRFPENLQALAPRFAGKLPSDVISAEPYRYSRVDDANYVLYSVGWNEADEGGQVGSLSSGTGVDEKKGDWVWSLAPTEVVRLRK